MMTGGDPKLARARLRGAGLDEVVLLEKPFPFEDLMKRLGELVAPSDLAVAPAAEEEPSTPTPRPVAPKAVAAFMGNMVRSLGGRVL
jgi:hypothetical protein